MPKLFSRKSKGDADDAMTIGGFSMGTSSVSDRIMGRMRMSLGGISGRNVNDPDADSLDGGDDSLDRSLRSAGKSSISRRSSGSRPGFRRSRSLGRKLKPMPGLNSSVTRNGSNASNVVDGMMSEMDSSETMALTGRSMGRRAPSSRPALSRAPSAHAMRSDPDGAGMAEERFGRPRKEKSSKSKRKSSRHLKNRAVDQIPMEYSLSQLRQMSELELEKTLDKAGVPFEEIDEAIDKMAAVDISIDSSTVDQRKNSLVTLLINSGKVKLVRAQKIHQDSTRTLQTSNHSLYESNMYNASVHDGTDASISSIPYNDEIGASVSSGISVSSSVKESRKSKLDKIYELQSDNSNIKRENKSLKKTVKKLLEQLTNTTQKEKEAAALAEKYKKELEIGAAQSPVNVEGEQSGNKAAEEKSVTDINNNNNVLQSVSVQDSDASIEKLKNELKVEKTAHKSTEFRLKAEITLLTREVEGLQKELAQSLKSVEKKEKSAKEQRETASKLKRKLNQASSTVSKLKNEAECRDKLIESFTKILLQKIGVEDNETGPLDESTIEEEKMTLSTLEQSLKMSLAQDTKV